jgi:hypothetical protein
MNEIAEQITDDYIRLYDNRANRDVLVSMFDTAITEATTPLHAEITTLKNALNNVFDAEEKHAERAIEPVKHQLPQWPAETTGSKALADVRAKWPNGKS